MKQVAGKGSSPEEILRGERSVEKMYNPNRWKRRGDAVGDR